MSEGTVTREMSGRKARGMENGPYHDARENKPLADQTGGWRRKGNIQGGAKHPPFLTGWRRRRGDRGKGGVWLRRAGWSGAGFRRPGYGCRLARFNGHDALIRQVRLATIDDDVITAAGPCGTRPKEYACREGQGPPGTTSQPTPHVCHAHLSEGIQTNHKE